MQADGVARDTFQEVSDVLTGIQFGFSPQVSPTQQGKSIQETSFSPSEQQPADSELNQSSQFGKYSSLGDEEYSPTAAGYRGDMTYTKTEHTLTISTDEDDFERKDFEENQEEWEERVLEEILEVKDRDMLHSAKNTRLQNEQDPSINKQLLATGIPYYDNPANSSEWIQKVPPKPAKNSVFADEIRQKLMPKVYSLSASETRQRTKELLQLSDVGPPILIHDNAHSSSSAATKKGSSILPKGIASQPLVDMSKSFALTASKSKVQSQESQILHYKSNCDPLLVNQKKIYYTLPGSPPKRNASAGTGRGGGGDPESFPISPALSPTSANNRKKLSRTPSLPRKLFLALNRSSDKKGLIPSPSPLNTPGHGK
jgi:hypothetical protein